MQRLPGARRLLGASLLAVAVAFATGATGQDNVKVGVLFPLSGNAASAGQQSKAAVEIAAEIVNGQHPDVKGMPGVGLPNLEGGKIEVVLADHHGNPSTGQSQALRLIQQDKVTALLGAYQSSVKEKSLELIADIPYSANTTDLQGRAVMRRI